MNTTDNINNNSEPDRGIDTGGDPGRMPLLLLSLWIANVTFFLIYFVIHAVPHLMK